jgi:hypothetical protein
VRWIAVAGAAAGSLAYEILLVRWFAIEHFHHFASMAIGVAMLGWGAAGTWFALCPRAPTAASLAGSAAICALALLITPALALRLPFDPTQLGWDARQWGWLALLEALLAIPFAAAATTVLQGLELEPERPGRPYGASFLGAALGAVAALAALAVFDPARALAIPAVLAAVAAVGSAFMVPSRGARIVSVVVLALGAAALARPPWRLELAPSKALPQVEAYPDARRVAERNSPVGWMVAVRSASFRYAPGLSLAYEHELPSQTALFVDGTNVGALGHERLSSHLDALPSAMGYVGRAPGDVLVLAAGGTTEVEVALAHGARHVTAVELHGGIADLARRALPGGSVDWVIADARSYLEGAESRFDVIQLGIAGTPGSAGGLHALSEDFLHTVDAYAGCLNRLSPAGVLAVSCWLDVPPRAAVRLILTAADALRRTGVRDLGVAMVVAHSWSTVTVLVKPSGFTSAEIAALERWAARLQFDLDWTPGRAQPAVSRNDIGAPVLHEAARAAHDPEAARRFAGGYPFRVEPVGDARPYPHHFVGWGALPRLLGPERGSVLPFAEWGPITMVATLVQSTVLGAVLLAVPWAVRDRRSWREAEPARAAARSAATLAYFGAIGFGYLAAELAAIQQLGLLLGHPIYAVAAALAGFLICSGIGSLLSDRVRGVAARWLLVGIALLLAFEALVLLPVVHALQAASLPVRAAAALVALAPPALLMGLPFPVGLRRVAASGSDAAWAWAANGVASVITAPLAALIALEAGGSALFGLAALAYAIAATSLRPREREG